MMEGLRRGLRPIAQGVRAMIGRCVLAALDDSDLLQAVQVKLAGRTLDDVERFGEWGLLSRPPVGAEGVALFLGGSGSHGVVIGTEHGDYRPRDAAPGESGLYTTDGTTEIRVQPDGTVLVRAATRVRVEAPQVVIDSPDVQVAGGTLKKLLNEDALTLWNGHTHNGGAVPDQQLQVDTHTTTQTRAG